MCVIYICLHLTKLLPIFASARIDKMDKLFNVIFLDEAFEFLKSLDKKHYEKIKVPDNEILKAKQSRVKYFEDKERSKDKKK
jgi:hypothetical protein